MKFEVNLRELRKQHGLSQEELAEQLSVSRQAVSKWENGSAYPELDKLMLLCELFQCKMDDLLNGEVKEQGLLSKAVYEQHENKMSKLITLGVCIVLFAASIYCFMEPIYENEMSYVNYMVFMFLVSIAILFFVYAGMSISNFHRKYKQAPLHVYCEEEIDIFHKKYQLAMVVGVGIVLVSVIFYLGVEEIYGEAQANGIFMFMMMCACAIFVYFGLQKSKFSQTEPVVQITKESEAKIGKWCGCIMLIAVAIYLSWSFIWNSWKISWIVLPIGGILCGIASILLHKEEE